MEKCRAHWSLSRSMTRCLESVSSLLFWILPFCLSTHLQAGIHSVPVTLTAQSIKTVQYHPISKYRVFRTSEDGTAIPIPFQIDEKDRYGDYILDQGKLTNSKLSNGIFDFRDELSFMGNDVGPVKIPKKWPFAKPAVLHELTFKLKDKLGAVYVGAYFDDTPPLADDTYVNFDIKKDEIVTSRFRYRFDHKNYLVVRGIDINKPLGKLKYPLVDSSTLFLKADLKYFLTFTINQKDIESDLEAYKVGPIRCIARVNFNYKFLKLNFDLGMYTEVSFFSNSVVLPAIVDNPLNGKKVLNAGSEFYYGFSIVDNPWTLKIDTNMPEYQENSLLSFLQRKNKAQPQYWFSATASDYMIYVEFEPSVQMRASGNIPMFYKENTPSAQMKNRETSAKPLGKSPVNFAIAMDLTAFSEGQHNVAIRLFVENYRDPALLDEYRTINEWQVAATRIATQVFK